MKDNRYYKLLYLAKSSPDYKNKFNNLDEVVDVLNDIVEFKNIHKRIIPLLKNKVTKLGLFSRLKPNVQKALVTENNNAVVSEMIKREQLNRIVQLFNKKGVPIILLKGIAFGYSLYSTSSPRISNDIDILVKAKDWEIAKEILCSIMHPLKITNNQVFDDLYESTFVPKTQAGAVVDLHKSLIHPILFKIKEKDIWADSYVANEFNNENVRMLSPEHNLIHQALHAYKDMDFCKYNLVDTYEIINILNPSIEKSISIANKWGAKVPLFFLLNNCRLIMDLDIDPNSIKTLSPPLLIKGIANKLLVSESSRLVNKKKSMHYRFNQLISQFIFTSSVIRPINFQWLYLKTAIKQIRNK
jgi:hypothetical protein